LAQERWRAALARLDSLQGVWHHYTNGQIRYGRVWLSLWDSYGLKHYDLGPGSISEDARGRGRWYINLCATPKQKPMQQTALFNDSVGIDLGLKDFAATSDGALVEA
jgi:putative transposase